jgi:four helix bundle protein
MYKSFKEMPIWQKAMKVCEEIYRITDALPANIAEAFGRNHSSDKINFYYMSRGSLTETQSHLEYGKRVGYVNNTSAEDLDNILNELYNEINKVILRLKGTSK